LSAIAVILRHGRENQRTVCYFIISAFEWSLVYTKKAVLWQRNRAIPSQKFNI